MTKNKVFRFGHRGWVALVGQACYVRATWQEAMNIATWTVKL